MNWVDYIYSILSLTAWREARGEGHEGMRAVAHVIFNRARSQKKSISEVCTARLQFSSLTSPGDPMLIQWPQNNDAQFEDAMSISESIYAGNDVDPTGGATMYANLSVCKPDWDFSKLIKTVQIGHHTFFKEK